MAAEFPGRKEQLIFLINNYDMMVGVYSERTSELSEEAAAFEQLLQARSHEFAEEELAPCFGGIMAFVRDTEHALEQHRNDRSKIPVDQRVFGQPSPPYSNQILAHPPPPTPSLLHQQGRSRR